MKLLRALQIVDSDGRLHIPVLLAMGWIPCIFAASSPGWFHAVVTVAILLNLQADRYLKARDVQKLHAAELERIAKLEAELGEIRGALSLATQRTMF